jgi:hypothetical protein
VKLGETAASHWTKLNRSFFRTHKILINVHDVDGGVLVSVKVTMIMASHYSMNLFGFLQNQTFVPFLWPSGTGSTSWKTEVSNGCVKIEKLFTDFGWMNNWFQGRMDVGMVV